jgi:hypothetical protein
MREILRMRNALLTILLSLFVSTTAVRADDAPKGDKSAVNIEAVK